MITDQDYALLSLYVYSVENTDLNRPNLLPDTWTPLDIQKDDLLGFSYGVFLGPDSKIVVAYTGTNESIDWVSNIGSGAGVGSPQATAAALVYLQAKEQYGAEITFTGHSLGGGLASIMSVWLDRPAVVFDHAPFELSARNPFLVLSTKTVLLSAGYDLGEFASYNEVLNFATREVNVNGHHLQGEALQYLRLLQPTIGSSQPLQLGDGLGSVDLHSMALFYAAKLSPDFAQATFLSAQILPRVMDKNLYAGLLPVS